jgi:LysM repeat protein
MSSKGGIGGALLLCLVASGAAAQSTAEEPFAVLSRGRPLPHAERTVVVLPDSAPPAPPADSVRPPARGGTTPNTSGTRGGTTTAAPIRGGAANPGPAAAAPTPPPATPPATSGRTGTGGSTARPSSAPRTHTVKWGDTWYGIALEYDVSSSSLRAANPEVDPERLRAGIVLRIPSGPGSARVTTTGESTTTRPSSAPARRSHKVEAGESLWGIARRYGVSTAAIREANDMNDDRVRIGETLVIPAED